MGNTPAQLPNIDLPGAEYFNLAPNRTVALQGRRRLLLNGTLTSIPAATVQTLTLSQQIEAPFPPGAGIYIHRIDGLFVFNDLTLSTVIQAVRIGLAVSAINNTAYDLGIPVATLNQPPTPIIAITDREVLVPQRDISAIDSPQPASLPLFVTFTGSFHNVDATNSHTVQLVIKMFWTRLDGIVE